MNTKRLLIVFCVLSVAIGTLAEPLRAQSTILLDEVKYVHMDASGNQAPRPTVEDLKFATKVISEMKDVLPCYSFFTIKDEVDAYRKDRDNAVNNNGQSHLDELNAKYNVAYLLKLSVYSTPSSQRISVNFLNLVKWKSSLYASASPDSIFEILFEINRAGICPWKGEVEVKKTRKFDTTFKEIPPEYSVPIGASIKSEKCFFSTKDDWKENWTIHVRKPPSSDLYSYCFATVKSTGSSIIHRTQDLQGIMCWKPSGGNGVYPANQKYDEKQTTILDGDVDVSDVRVMVLMDQFGAYTLEVHGGPATVPCTYGEIASFVNDCTSKEWNVPTKESFTAVDCEVMQKLQLTSRGLEAVGNIKRSADLKAKSLSGTESYMLDGTHYEVKWDLKK